MRPQVQGRRSSRPAGGGAVQRGTPAAHGQVRQGEALAETGLRDQLPLEERAAGQRLQRAPSRPDRRRYQVAPIAKRSKRDGHILGAQRLARYQPG